MKKGILVLALATLLILPLAAMAGMLTEKAPLSDGALEGVTGQTGVTVDVSIKVTKGFVAWGDDNGTTNYTDAGYLSLAGMTINDGIGTAPGPTTINGLTIDVGTDTAGTSALIIGLPTISGQIAFNSLKLGSAANSGTSLGSLTIGDITMASSTVVIKPH